jgi:hypothetical protein
MNPIDRSKCPAVWVHSNPAADSYAAFRGEFHLPAEGNAELLFFGASWFNVWVDGAFAAEGPTRGEADEQEVVAHHRQLAAGRHVIAAGVHYVGVPTRLAPAQPPFFAALVRIGTDIVSIDWKALELPGFRSQTRRINPELGWIEWSDTRLLPRNWQEFDFDPKDWKPPVQVDLGATRFVGPRIAPVRQISHSLPAFAEDHLTETFGYELDDIPARFFLRDLNPSLPAQGLWRRYDLDRVRLGRLAITLDLPPGATVEIAYAEHLVSGRVPPYITLSAGPSCNMDHFISRGGEQEFTSLTPKGGRFVEVHILAPPDKVRFIKARYLERTYHGDPIGRFECDDDLLNRIWLAGVETYRACSEDAIIDNPTRERGQWTGDAIVGMETASVAYDDLRLVRRALVGAARGARGDGLISGLSPGNNPMSSYAAQWTTGCVRYQQLSGDRSLLEDLHEAAAKNMAAFEPFVKEDGLHDGLGWAFIDWGYLRPAGAIDPALNYHYLAALRSMARWCELLGKPRDRYDELAARISSALDRFLAAQTRTSWNDVEYHVAALALAKGLDVKQRPHAIDAIRRHLLNCFPNNPDGVRLSDPAIRSSQVITPYFAHFAFPPLIEQGQMDFVLDQYRVCWGWMLSEGRTTMLEVFDPRWSHCHQWSACPSWQLSRYVLGLHPRYDRGADHFDLALRPGRLKRSRGRVPMKDGCIEIDWERAGSQLKYRMTPPREIHVRFGGKIIEVNGRTEWSIPAEPIAASSVPAAVRHPPQH